jgi:Xaa-Pro aminopeptidase
MMHDFYRAPDLFGAFLFSLFLCLNSPVLPAQEFPSPAFEMNPSSLYDTDLLPHGFHAARRQALRQLMADSSVAVFFSASIKNRSNDVAYTFHQDPDFYYFTGLNEPEAVLFIFKNGIRINGVTGNEVLFLKDKDVKSERWTGKLLGTEGAKSKLGFQAAFPSSAFLDLRINSLSLKKIYSFKPPREYGDDLRKHFFNELATVPASNTDDSSLKEFTATLREIKLNEELDLMRKAISITCAGIKEAMKALEPGMNEYDVEAIVDYVFKSKGAEDEGYPSIVGAGENSCILHYESNRKKLVSNDLLVCDVGAEYHGYSADVTRTIPVNGKFSVEQKAIYTIVLEAQNAGISKCKPGEYFRAPHNAAMEIVQKGLLELGIIKTSAEASNYFFHGTSHYLGLDVHDAGMYGKLLPNNVITVEPGIYIPEGSACDKKWWNIGIRIEDDILITQTEPEVLSACIAKTTDEIEAIMQKESLFNLLKK